MKRGTSQLTNSYGRDMRTCQALRLVGRRTRHRATRSFPMADTAIHPIPKQGKFRRALAAVSAWLQALHRLRLHSRPYRTLGAGAGTRLKEELRQSREASSGDAHLGG